LRKVSGDAGGRGEEKKNKSDGGEAGRENLSNEQRSSESSFPV
jgi:hypothetical protein